MPKYVRFEEDKDLEWLQRLLERAIVKMKTNPGPFLNEENAEIIPRVLDSVVSAADIENASAIGVSEKVLKTDRKKEKEKKASKSQKRKRRTKEEIAMDKKLALCKIHPTYEGARPPRRKEDCKDCWKAYKKQHPLDYTAARRKFLREQRKAKAAG